MNFREELEALVKLSESKYRDLVDVLDANKELVESFKNELKSYATNGDLSFGFNGSYIGKHIGNLKILRAFCAVNNLTLVINDKNSPHDFEIVWSKE
jgi:tetrahydromethanopterin S-methyltransferase subunit B